MSCTHDCGCTPEIRDARTDEWVQIAPESARPATLTPEQPVKAPGQDGDLLLKRRKPVEVEWPNGNRLLRYVDEDGYQRFAGHVGNGKPYPWGDARIVRVLTEDKPAKEPVLSRRKTLYVSGPMTGLPDFNRAAFHKAADDLRARGYDVVNPAEVDLGPKATWEDYMRVHLATITSGDVHGLAMLPGWRKSKGARLEGEAAQAFGLPMRWCHDWPVIEDAPEPVDPDAAVIERVAQVLHKQGCSWCDTGEDLEAHYGSAREAWREDARAVLAVVREHTVMPRAEQ